MHELGIGLREADLSHIQRALSEEAVYRSPVLRRSLSGAALVEIMEIFCEAVSVTSLEEYGNSSTRVLVGQVTVGSLTGEATWVLRLDQTGKVRELSWQARPFNLSVRLANTFGAGLARRRGGLKPAIAAAGKPLGLMVAELVDRLSPWMIRRTAD